MSASGHRPTAVAGAQSVASGARGVLRVVPPRGRAGVGRADGAGPHGAVRPQVGAPAVAPGRARRIDRERDHLGRPPDSRTTAAGGRRRWPRARLAQLPVGRRTGPARRADLAGYRRGGVDPEIRGDLGASPRHVHRAVDVAQCRVAALRRPQSAATDPLPVPPLERPGSAGGDDRWDRLSRSHHPHRPGHRWAGQKARVGGARRDHGEQRRRRGAAE